MTFKFITLNFLREIFIKIDLNFRSLMVRVDVDSNFYFCIFFGKRLACIGHWYGLFIL